MKMFGGGMGDQIKRYFGFWPGFRTIPMTARTFNVLGQEHLVKFSATSVKFSWQIEEKALVRK